MMFGISYFRLAAYAVLAIVIGYLIYQYHTGQEAKAQIATITAQLKSEQDCLLGSICALRTVDEANKAAQAVAQAQQKAEKDNINARNARDKAAQDEADKQSAQIKQYQAELANIKNKHNPSCDEQRKLVIVCEVQ